MNSDNIVPSGALPPDLPPLLPLEPATPSTSGTMEAGRTVTSIPPSDIASSSAGPVAGLAATIAQSSGSQVTLLGPAGEFYPSPASHTPVGSPLNAKEIAAQLGTSKHRAQKAIDKGKCVALSEKIERLRSGSLFNTLIGIDVSLRSATEQAWIVDKLQKMKLPADSVLTSKRCAGFHPFTAQRISEDMTLINLKTHEGLAPIGTGNFAKVTFSALASSAESFLCAQKVQYIKSVGKIEARYTSLCSGCPYVIRVYHASSYQGSLVQTASGPSTERHSLILEYCDKGDLTGEVFKNMKPSERWTIFLQILEGVHAIHGESLIHGDLKPQNILLKSVDGQLEPRIIDLGIAQRLGRSVRGGTPLYMGPESIRIVDEIPQLRKTRATPAQDCFALGRIAAEVLAPGETQADLETLPEVLKEVIAGLQEKDPKKRMGLIVAMDKVGHGIQELQQGEQLVL